MTGLVYRNTTHFCIMFDTVAFNLAKLISSSSFFWQILSDLI